MFEDLTKVDRVKIAKKKPLNEIMASIDLWVTAKSGKTNFENRIIKEIFFNKWGN